MSIDEDLVERLMEGRSPGGLFGETAILGEPTTALAERAPRTERAVNATPTGWKRAVRAWHAGRSQLPILCEDRFPMARENTSGIKENASGTTFYIVS